jgi:putative membrane-bound dehydrogenase-like protein
MWLVGYLFLTIGNAQLREQTVEGTVFRVPEGVQVEKVAGSPLIERPIVAEWDEEGRLLVLEAAGPVEREAESAGARPHRLVRLVDENRDGVFDRRIVVAENLSFPVGVLARGNQVLVSAPPEIWLLSDDDGDGVCERREIWFNPGTATHCYNDLHGPYLGRDGWIYWTKGAFAAQSFTERDGEPLESKAAHIYRRRFEGGPIESVMTGGMDNPVEVVFSPAGERFFTSTFLQFPAGGRRDGIAHAIYGGLYGKDHDVLNGHWRTGDLMPIMTHLGPAAPSGLAWSESPALLGDAGMKQDASGVVRECLIAAQFNLQKVSVHRLIPQGASFQTEDVDLLSTDRIEFHPTDVLEDCDGSLLVLDTGGWYDLCCPSSAVDQSAALGGIYRLTSKRTNAAAAENLAVLEISNWDTAWDAVRSRTAWIRQRAEDWIVRHPEQCSGSLVEALENPNLAIALRLRAIWLLCRIGSDQSRRALVAALHSEANELRQAAATAIAVHKWPEEDALLEALQREQAAPALRALAEAIGRVGGRKSIPGLMESILATSSMNDRVLQHSLHYGLVELNQSPAISAFQFSAHNEQWLAATRALHERSDPRLNSERLLNVMMNPASSPPDVSHAGELLAQHPELLSRAPELASSWYRDASLNLRNEAGVSRLVAGWCREPAFEQLIASELNKDIVGIPPPSRSFLLSLILRSRLEQVPGPWQVGLAHWLNSKLLSTEEQRSLLQWLQAAAWPSEPVDKLFRAILDLANSDPDLAPTALACLPFGTEIESALLDQLVQKVESDADEESLATVWRALARVKIPEMAARRLAETAPRWKLGLFATGVEVLAASECDSANLRLLELLPELPLARTVPVESYQNWYREGSEAVRVRAEQLTQSLAESLAEEGAQRWKKVEQLLASLPAGGDPNRGMQVFRSTQAACSSCHQVAYVGGLIGPDMSRIGSTRSRRELLEAIAFPSARQEQSYRSEKFALIDGRVLSGLVEETAGDWLMLRTGPEQRVKIRRDEIEERAASDLSLMPAGIVEALTPEQLADLLAFLESRK